MCARLDILTLPLAGVHESNNTLPPSLCPPERAREHHNLAPSVQAEVTDHQPWPQASPEFPENWSRSISIQNMRWSTQVACLILQYEATCSPAYAPSWWWWIWRQHSCDKPSITVLYAMCISLPLYEILWCSIKFFSSIKSCLACPVSLKANFRLFKLSGRWDSVFRRPVNLVTLHL